MIRKSVITCMLIMLPAATMAAVVQDDGRPVDGMAQWRITEKEVTAVQAELIRRGFYKSKLTGVLDRDTREAVKSFQQANALKVTGRIDRPTYERLQLKYPATGKEAESLRRDGTLPAIGYGIKDATSATGRAVSSAAVRVKEGTQTGLEKTWDAGSTVVSKTKETAQGVGTATVKGARSVGRGTQKASTAMIGRSEAVVQADVREVLDAKPETEKWFSSVKSGTVTLKIPPQNKADVGAVVSEIRKIPGVKSVFVIAL
jgi:peptidoglycan hydrolase-like protein with peptidoglycan-binding domain